MAPVALKGRARPLFSRQYRRTAPSACCTPFAARLDERGSEKERAKREKERICACSTKGSNGQWGSPVSSPIKWISASSLLAFSRKFMRDYGLGKAGTPAATFFYRAARSSSMTDLHDTPHEKFAISLFKVVVLFSEGRYINRAAGVALACGGRVTHGE